MGKLLEGLRDETFLCMALVDPYVRMYTRAWDTSHLYCARSCFLLCGLCSRDTAIGLKHTQSDRRVLSLFPFSVKYVRDMSSLRKNSISPFCRRVCSELGHHQTILTHIYVVGVTVEKGHSIETRWSAWKRGPSAERRR